MLQHTLAHPQSRTDCAVASDGNRCMEAWVHRRQKKLEFCLYFHLQMEEKLIDSFPCLWQLNFRGYKNATANKMFGVPIVSE